MLQAGKAANDFIFKMQQLRDPFMPSTTSNFSLKRKAKNQCGFGYLTRALLSTLATQLMRKSSEDLQWTATETRLFSTFSY